MLSNWWGQGAGGIPIYPNMIWGLEGSLLTGLGEFTDYSGMALRGTDDDTKIGTGSSSSPTIALTSTTDGAHNGPADTGVDNGREPSGDTYISKGWDQTLYGGHPHSLSISHSAAKNKCRLVIATDRRKSFPAGSILFSDSGNLTGCSGYDLFNSYGGILTASTANARQSSSTSVTCSTASVYHDHTKNVQGSRVDAATVTDVGATYMTHNHSVSISVSKNLYRLVLSAWLASEEIRRVDASAPIVLYIGAGIPPRWELAPNSVNRFIYNSGTAGATVNGGNTASVSATLQTAYHNHPTTGTASITGVRIPHTGNVGHGHTASGTKTWYPPYKFVKFIRYAGGASG